MRTKVAWTIAGLAVMAGASAGCFIDPGLGESEGGGSTSTTSTTSPTSGADGECGDSVVQPPEECDQGSGNGDEGPCTSACRLNVCGDGAQSFAEGCDDGNLVDGDGCSSSCRSETCGNGVVEPPELCDDANTVDDDECTSLCRPPACGDGIHHAGEQCDLGPSNDNAGTCKLDCTLNVCGDGYVGPGEECDGSEGCSTECTLAGGVCGDGVVQTGEACDDGNDGSGDACTAQCAAATCGDGFVYSGVEECDDDNTNDGDGCSSQCTVESAACGDNHLDPGEQCDDGNQVGGDGCSASCTSEMTSCGDGLPANNEECDDGNILNGDGCSSTCTKEWRRVFVTKTLYTGKLGGLAGADMKCQTSATAAGLPGTYRAWLSSSQSSPAQSFLKSTVPYRLPTGLTVAQSWADLIDGSLAAAINRDEYGSPAPNADGAGCDPGPLAWTNTEYTGVATSKTNDCDGWSIDINVSGSTFGSPASTGPSWTEACGPWTCGTAASLYCVEQ